jgi:hypothetical protein
VHGLAATCVHALTGRPPYDTAGARIPVAGLATDPAARRLLAVLEAALDPDPARRPDAASLARSGFDAAVAVPLALDLLDSGAVGDAVGDAAGVADGDAAGVADGEAATAWGLPLTQVSVARARPVVAAGADQPRSRGGRRRRSRRWSAPSWSAPSWSAVGRRGAAVVGATVAVALAAVTGIAWAGAGPATSPGQDVGSARSQQVARTASANPTSPAGATGGRTPEGRSTSPSPRSTNGSTDGPAPAAGAERPTEHPWSARLRALDGARASAFAAGDVDALPQVYATGSPALRRDRRAMERLAAAGLRAARVRLRAVEVRVVSSAEGEVRLVVTDVLGAYRLVDADTGRVVERRPGRGPASWLLTLTREAGGWRIWDVTRR